MTGRAADEGTSPMAVAAPGDARRRRLTGAALAGAAGLAAGCAGAWLPGGLLAAAIGVAVAVLVVLALVGYGYRSFWYPLLLLWLGYILFGKGFAYLGTRWAHVGELVLALAVAALVIGAARRRLAVGVRRLPGELWVLAAFLAWQAARTIPYLGVHGIDALRDGALWGYATFAIAIVLLVPGRAIDDAVRRYGRLAPYLPLAMLAAMVAARLGWAMPTLPGSPVPLGTLKGGEIGVNLGGIGALMLLAPIVAGGGGRVRRSLAPWLLWWSCFFVVAATGRAAALAAAVALAIATAFAGKVRWRAPVAAALLVAGVATLFELRATVRRGELSTRQVIASLASIVASRTREGAPALRQQSKEWRLRWWSDVVSYTVQGPYRWVGKGYGINLAEDDGYLVGDRTLRSPHNVFMTILARSGVPGLLLWLAFIVAFLLRLLRHALPGAAGAPERRRFAAWALAFLAAFLIDASFDVFLEGPMGGIPFWSLIGICWVKLRDVDGPGESGPQPAAP